MATPSTSARKRTGAPGDTLHRLAGRSALRGFANLFGNENRGWWRTRAWLVQLAVWLGIINGLIALVTYGESQDASGAIPLFETLMQVFFKAGGPAIAVGAVIAAQGALVGEKQLGTAAWVMSKPVGRSAFVLAKLAAYALVFVVLAIAVPSVVFFGQTALRPRAAAGAAPVPGGARGDAPASALLPRADPAAGRVRQLARSGGWRGAWLHVCRDAAAQFPATTGGGLPVAARGSGGGRCAGYGAAGDLARSGRRDRLWTLLFVAVALWRFAREEF